VSNQSTNSKSGSTPLNTSRDYEFQMAIVNAILEASPDGILVVDDNAKVVSVNLRFFEIWNIPVEIEPTNRAVKLRSDEDEQLLKQVTARVKDKQGFVNRIQELYENPAINENSEVELLDGRTLERHSKALYGAQQQYLGRVWFLRDITERKMEENTLAELAQTDSLTGIANRRYFQQQALEAFLQAQRDKHPLSIILCDIDKFKNINDTYGHAAGDSVLKALCSRLLAKIRNNDILGRLGGDELAIVLPGTDTYGACIIADRLRFDIEQLEIHSESHTFQATITCGIASIKKHDDSIEAVINRADEALYVAKNNGRNRIEAIS